MNREAAPGPAGGGFMTGAGQGEALEIRAPTVGQEYYFAIEAFDEVGVSTASEPVRSR